MLRGRFPLREMSRGVSGEAEGEERSGIRRTVTPVYSVDPSRNHMVSMKPQGPKLARDRLCDLLRDGRFHSAYELEENLPGGGWVDGLRGLLALKYAFDLVGNHVRMRFRDSSEPRQELVELLSKLDATVISVEPVGEVESEGEEAFETGFDPLKDEVVDPEEAVEKVVRGGMVLSDPPEALSLSAANSASMTAAILAKKNSGKTYLAMVLAEEFMSSDSLPVPMVFIDPTGVGFGLKATVDGMPSPYNILSLGGRHSDLPITAKDGSKAALVVNAIRPNPMIIDISLMAPVEQHEFVADFVETLFTTAERSPIHIIIDEADEFAPQTLNSASRNQKRCLDAIDRLVRRGRSKGIGVTMITQRSAVIAKNVLSQVDSLWLLNMVEPRDLLAVEGWLKHGVSDQQRTECLNQIPRLPPGTAYFLQTGVSPKFRRFKVRRKRTFDSSKTPGMKGYAEPLLSKPPALVLVQARDILKVSVLETNASEEVADES